MSLSVIFHAKKVNFGIRQGSFVTGYVDSTEILDQKAPRFDTLVSGLGWLVRKGMVNIDSSFDANIDDEGTKKNEIVIYHSLSPSFSYINDLVVSDMSIQSTGTQFPDVLSARTAIGHDLQGRLMILQVEGETWVRGKCYRFILLGVFHSEYDLINVKE